MDELNHKGTIYVNSTKIISTVYDFTIFATHLVPIIGNDNRVFDNEALNDIIISMSPQHAKALFTALEKQISKYENEFGVINLPNMEIEEIHTAKRINENDK